MLQVPGPTTRIVWPRGEHIEATSSGGNFIERILHRVLLGGNGGSSSSNFRPRLGCHAEAITTPAVQSAQTLPPGDGKGEISLAHFTGSVAKPDEEDGALKFKRSLLECAFREGGRASGKESCVSYLGKRFLPFEARTA
jgi:hypothetical protein